jgi:prevent-host-death family protein
VFSGGDDAAREVRLDTRQAPTYAITYVTRKAIMTTVSVTEARKKLYRLLDDVSQSRQPLQISGKRSSAVLVSEEDWRSIQETLYLLAVPGMRESIIEGLKTPVAKCSKGLRW